MISIQHNQSLKSYNTFKVDVCTKYFAVFNNVNELIDILNNEIIQEEKILILGEGSNILFTKYFNGIVLINNIKGIKINKETKQEAFVSVGAGENWHAFVLWSIKQGFSGIENLALIPGLVGASPIQNIGAYGVEAQEFITEVKYIDLKAKEKKILTNEECKFDYRDSIFKNKLKNKVVITEVIYRLSKKPKHNISYSVLKKELEETTQIISTESILNSVINIRNRKLPNPKEIPNGGSFFKNPLVSNTKFKTLRNKFPNIIGYKSSEKNMKIAAAWLIDNAGWKGYKKENCGVHKNQALVLINYGTATGRDILNLAMQIKKSVQQKYNIILEEEVTIL